MKKTKNWYLNILASAWLLTACASTPAPLETLPPATSPASSATATGLPPPAARTATLTPLPSLTATPASTPTPTISPTPDPYAAYTIEHLAGRAYGGGELRIVETLDVNSYFTRTLVAYPSDGLTIYGFMNLPRRGMDGQPLPAGLSGAQPTIIAVHGYIEPEVYNTIDYTTRYADALARAGFVVIHPNLRGYAPSDDGDNLFRVGMALDVLNLIALVQAQAGKPGALALANGQSIGVWGHSMGGGISTRVITVSPQVRAAVLYGAMSGDERANYERIYSYFSNQTRGLEELAAPEQVFPLISPIFHLERIQAEVSIHHGKNDVDVPLSWSLDLCRRLGELGKAVECFTYDNQPHTFYGDGDQLFIQRTIEFFRRTLAGM